MPSHEQTTQPPEKTLPTPSDRNQNLNDIIALFTSTGTPTGKPPSVETDTKILIKKN